MDKGINPDWERKLASYDRGVRRRAARQRERVIMIRHDLAELIRDDEAIPLTDLNHLVEKAQRGES